MTNDDLEEKLRTLAEDAKIELARREARRETQKEYYKYDK